MIVGDGVRVVVCHVGAAGSGGVVAAAVVDVFVVVAKVWDSEWGFVG